MLRSRGPQVRQKAFRRNAQPAPVRGCSSGFGEVPPTSEMNASPGGETFIFAMWVPLCPACQFCSALFFLCPRHKNQKHKIKFFWTVREIVMIGNDPSAHANRPHLLAPTPLCGHHDRTIIPSGQYLNYSRIESGQFNTSVVVFELPGDFYTFRITSGRPSTNLLFKTIQIRKWLS